MTLDLGRLRVDILATEDLSDSDVEQWQAIQASHPAFESPLLSADFAFAVSRARDDVRVAVYRRGDRAVGFLAHHRRPGGFGRPIGSPFSDYHALLCAADLGVSGPEAVRMAGLKAFRHNGLIDPHGLFAGTAEGQHTYAIELSGTPEAFLETVRAASPKKFKNYRRLQNRLAESGALRMGPDRSQATFDQIMGWKSEQFTRTGVQDVLKPDWTRRMMQSLFDTTDGRMTGLLLTLYAGDVLVGGHFGVMAAGVFHPWIASTNPELAALSPGQAFLDQAIRSMPALGIRVYDLGPGHDHYKKPFASTEREVGVGLTVVSGAIGTLPRVKESVWSLGGLDRVSAVSRIRKRLDHIAAVDPSASGRARGLLEAAWSIQKRLASADAKA
ncbi:GNAT family N-acetyltransferase [Brevundimonas variabilis]|uniref:CelD/BcsL family acetyltransferase involved in cellulose biosynthesis n=1 Tax=Brevundimonas variabilis TaxID=74312 RepID=A0A7W9CH87_9CAUL|nr:GNAT family N-acetyltransferase [Brevundimonas variabilis]MBB5745613.1 CelD/BcsL family acetyltransferase involved in cellulose biosynthesis [Brevundimonas variabilis]